MTGKGVAKKELSYTACGNVNWCNHYEKQSGYSLYRVVQSFPTLCGPIDHGPPGYSVLGILQARILEWVAIPFSTASS